MDTSLNPNQRPLALLEAQAALYQKEREAASKIDVASELAKIDNEIADVTARMDTLPRMIGEGEWVGAFKPQARHDLEAEFSVGLRVELGLESLMKSKHGGEPSVLQRLVL